ncbi:MAG: hypothetical protein ACUVRM_11740 [Bacillota bacterium]
MRETARKFWPFAGKVVVVHTVTYFIFGLIMSNLFDYGRIFQHEIIRDFMRPIHSSFVFIGPFVQPIRGFLFALALWPLRDVIIGRKRGWLILWGLFVALGILGPPAAAPSSLEGLLYSRLPLWYHLIGLPEILLQTLTFSLILVWWEKRPSRSRQGPREAAWWPEILKAVMVACFAYMGYAVGSILTAILARVSIDMKAAAFDWKTQLMFVVAFFFNILFILLLSQKQAVRKIHLWKIFLLCWFVETVVPLVYQWIFLTPMPIYFAVLIGFFPALVIAIGMRLGYR